MIENLTDEIEQQARAYLDRIDQMGGALKAIEAGYIQGEIGDAAYAYQRAIERGEQIVVGMNQFQVPEEVHLPRHKIDPTIEFEQKRRLATLRASRDNSKVGELRAQLENAARGTDNLMPTILACVENDVTLGGTAGATTAVLTGSGNTFNIAVSGMTGNGTVTASIPAGVAADNVGNGNSASTSTDNTVTYDTTGPAVTINQAAGQADPTSVSPINFTVVFAEPVTGFATGDAYGPPGSILTI